MEPFIHNHHFNYIQQQIYILQYSVKSVHDKEILSAIRYEAERKITSIFTSLTEEQKRLVTSFSDLHQEHEFYGYLESLLPYRVMFPYMTEVEVKNLFPNKKMDVPALSYINFKAISYLGWNDHQLQKKYIIYPFKGRIRAIEAHITSIQQKNVCALCNQFTKVGLVTAQTENSSGAYYKAVGNYICMDSYECNRNITNIANVDTFVERIVTGE
ncbi:FusB/FusC family EF-G-binding protein [Pontibacillus salicampi]|uniref:FusB/FusC family EF-G-binding protein n=1 Tax=Pontibacillus salicampi TaxID=1449801 RepID=A0ABV6LKN2_9BACI